MHEIDNNIQWHRSSSVESCSAPLHRLPSVSCRDHDDMMSEMCGPTRRRDDDDYERPRREPRRSQRNRRFTHVDRRGRAYELVRQGYREEDDARRVRETTFLEGVGHAGAGVGGFVAGAGGLALMVTGAMNLAHRAPRPGIIMLAAGAALAAVGWTLVSAVWKKH